jgi:hypothetical protein
LLAIVALFAGIMYWFKQELNPDALDENVIRRQKI